MNGKQNLVINGSGSYGGGVYHKIKVRGEGTIASDVESNSFKTFGTSDILKNSKTGQFDVFGEAKVRGNLQCDKMKIFGTMKVYDDAKIRKAKVWGTFEVGQSLSGEEADIKGSLKVKGNTDFERFKSTGSFQLGGLLNADSIDVSLRYGKSAANEIGGERITVRKKNSLLPFWKSDGYLQASLIEGDLVELEYTIADIVRGKQVIIGPGCEIGKVEFSETFQADMKAIVKEKRKIE